MPKLSSVGKLALNLIPLLVDVVGGARKDEELNASIRDVQERLSDVEEHLDRMYISLRKELGVVQLYLKISLFFNGLLLLLLLIVLIRVW